MREARATRTSYNKSSDPTGRQRSCGRREQVAIRAFLSSGRTAADPRLRFTIHGVAGKVNRNHTLSIAHHDPPPSLSMSSPYRGNSQPYAVNTNSCLYPPQLPTFSTPNLNPASSSAHLVGRTSPRSPLPVPSHAHQALYPSNRQ
ncbi:hypothetical protein PENSPDRAFT_183482 [Peniophora sp. CONT]|nr:hypothetical protein PENSPDRAFT_183482 [Peniophora sp. CONT]